MCVYLIMRRVQEKALPQVKKGGEDDDVVKQSKCRRAWISFASKAAAVNSYAKKCPVTKWSSFGNSLIVDLRKRPGNVRYYISITCYR